MSAAYWPLLPPRFPVSPTLAALLWYHGVMPPESLSVDHSPPAPALPLRGIVGAPPCGVGRLSLTFLSSARHSRGEQEMDLLSASSW